MGVILVATVSFLMNRDNPLVSWTSFVYLIYLLSPFTMRLTLPDDWRIKASKSFWNGYRYLMLLTSLLGLLQLLMMDLFVSFRDLIPETFRVTGYNTTNEIVYGSSIFRANGFFFYEPSFFSQFLALAILVEIRTRNNLVVLGLFVAGMLSSVSGTGLIMLSLGLLIIAMRTKSVSKKAIFIASFPMLAIVWIGLYAFPEFFISRLGEFMRENSSAYTRFVAPLIYVYTSYTSSLFSMLFGIGPGLASSLRDAEVMADFPGISKILFEYGLLGTFLVTLMYLRFSAKANMVNLIQWPILLIQFFMNNGIFTPLTVTFFILIALFSSNQCFNISYNASQMRKVKSRLVESVQS